MQIYWNERKRCIRKEFNSKGIGLGHQHGCRFIVLGHQYDRRDVTRKHSIPGADCLFFDLPDQGPVDKLLLTSNNTLYPALTASFTAERDDILLADEIVPAPP